MRTGARASASMIGEAVGGKGGVERDIGAAGLEDGEQRDEHVGGAGGADADEDLRTDAQTAEAAGEPVGAAVELAVAERSIANSDGDCVGSARRLRLDPAMDESRTRPAPRGLLFQEPRDQARFSSSVRSSRRSFTWLIRLPSRGSAAIRSFRRFRTQPSRSISTSSSPSSSPSRSGIVPCRIGAGQVPSPDDLLAFAVEHPRQVGEPPIGVVGHRLEQGPEVPEGPFDRVGRESPRIEADLDRNRSARHGGHGDRVMSPLDVPGRLDAQSIGPLAQGLHERQVLDGHDALEQRHPRRDLAPALDPRERDRLEPAQLDEAVLEPEEPGDQVRRLVNRRRGAAAY